MTETKYNMQFTEIELNFFYTSLCEIESMDEKQSKLLTKIENKINKINKDKMIEYMKQKKKVESKVEEFKMDPNNTNSKETQLAWFEYKQLLEEHKELIMESFNPIGEVFDEMEAQFDVMIHEAEKLLTTFNPNK